MLCVVIFKVLCGEITYIPENIYGNIMLITRSSFLLQSKFSKQDTYYIFNHVDITLTYHSSTGEDWGQAIGGIGGRIVTAKLEPRRSGHRSTCIYKFTTVSCNVSTSEISSLMKFYHPRIEYCKFREVLVLNLFLIWIWLTDCLLQTV